MTDKPEGQHAEAKPAKVEAKAAVATGDLADAGGTSNPLVHDALARLEIARTNRAALDVPPEDVEAADAAVADAEAALAELGYKA